METSAATRTDLHFWHRDSRRTRAQEFWEQAAKEHSHWKNRNRYYHQQLEQLFRSLIPAGSRVLEIGCGDGSLLAAVEPSYGVGIDFGSTAIAQAKAQHPQLHFFVDDAEDLHLAESFDYVILSGLLGSLIDIQRALEELQKVCDTKTRIIISDYNYLWEPILRFAQAVGWAMPQPPQNWLPVSVISYLLDLAGFEVIRSGGRVLLPVKIPILSSFSNRFIARLPLFSKLCLVSTVVARSRWQGIEKTAATCSVIVPCRNERGTIESLLDRVPRMGPETEIIFVDGHSTDGTQEEIQRLIRQRPERQIKLFDQIGTGKGSAVREGFARAQGNILMILDADLTVAPEELPKFYRALTTGAGELINGTRLIYPMDGQAMQLLNLLANKMFGLLFTYLLEQEFHDTLCGTKAIWRADYEKIARSRHLFGKEDPFGDFDLLFGAARLNLHITEIPVRYTERVYGETNIKRFTHGWQLLKTCWVAVRRLKFCA